MSETDMSYHFSLSGPDLVLQTQAVCCFHKQFLPLLGERPYASTWFLAKLPFGFWKKICLILN